MKIKMICLLGLLLSLCGCASKPVENDVEDNTPTGDFTVVAAGSMTFNVNAEYTVENPQDINLGVYQFVDTVNYVGMRGDTTYVIGHIKDDVYQDLQETANVAVTYFRKAYGIEVSGEKYNLSDILEDECELGEIGYHLKLLPDSVCIIAYKPNNVSDDLSVRYYNEVDNTVFDNVIVGESTSSLGGPVVNRDMKATYHAEELDGNVVAYSSMYNDDNSICLLLQTYSGFEWSNNVEDRYQYDESQGVIVDSVAGSTWSPTWMVNPNREDKPQDNTLPSETFGTE